MKGVPRIIQSLVPVGSPYGFTNVDWDEVAEAKSATNRLVVVFGYGFKSEHYEEDKLIKNVGAMFDKAVKEYNNALSSIPIELIFRPLTAGYGEHLFNEIVRNIISADIAVFDISDLNPNVMLEMGVALTWGVRVLPIKKEGCPEVPSDISGQTWVDYRNGASEFVEPEHENKMLRMVEQAARKKVTK